jgi:hypothetical protein
VGVEKVDIRKNGVILGDRKCLDDPRKSFVGHPDATLFCDLFSQMSFSTATGLIAQNAIRTSSVMKIPPSSIGVSLDFEAC